MITDKATFILDPNSHAKALLEARAYSNSAQALREQYYWVLRQRGVSNIEAENLLDQNMSLFRKLEAELKK